jgi:hypothetical protein
MPATSLSRLGVGDTLRPGTSALFRQGIEQYLKAGGNLVQVMPGTESIIAETVDALLAHGKVQREELIVCTTFPRKLDPYLASAPPELPASVFYTPDAYKEVLRVMPPLSVEGASHPMIVEDFDEVPQRALCYLLVCCLPSALCCLLSAVCRLLSAVCCLLSAVCCLLSAVCSPLSAVCSLLSAVWCLLSAVCFHSTTLVKHPHHPSYATQEWAKTTKILPLDVDVCLIDLDVLVEQAMETGKSITKIRKG